MHFLLPFFLSASLLFNLVFASLASLSSLGARLVNISTIDPATSNTSLGYIPPIGPEWFSCGVAARSSSVIQPKDIFVTTIRMLEQICQGDFNSRMPHARAVFPGPNNFFIRVTSSNPAQPIVRRFVMWALSRILLSMRFESSMGYHAGIFVPRWRGANTGMIEIGYARASSDQSREAPAIDGAVNATATVGDDEIAWIFAPSPDGPIMTMWDIAMGTIGALIEASKDVLPAQRVQQFSGNFLPEASAVCHSRATIMPSHLSQSILIRTLAAGSLWALEDENFHELVVKVLLDGELIAQGGVNKMPSSLFNLNNGTAVNNPQS